VVYRDGLENRYGLTPIGGSNPSPSARNEEFVNDYIRLGIWVAIVATVFIILWRKGTLLRLSNYVQETREELRKCSWPTVVELKGSTVVVMISIIILGAFTVGVDFILAMFVQMMNRI
jgi:preprotein translocase subunit SecE